MTEHEERVMDDIAEKAVVFGFKIDQLEKAMILKAIERYGSRAHAAHVVGIGERTIYRKLQEYKVTT